MQSQLCWYALAVKHQSEQKIRALLEWKGFAALSPTYTVRRQWSDRVKEIDLPLFGGYVFAQFAFDQRFPVLDTPGVSRIVSFGGQAIPISSGEIEAIQAACRSGRSLRPWPELHPGDRVRIERGPLRGLEGTLLKSDGKIELVIGIELLQRAISVALDHDAVSPITQRNASLSITPFPNAPLAARSAPQGL
jgi:transcription antitermination factor NusG